jgi:hypothetical protein
MVIQVTPEFIGICQRIAAEAKSEEDWAAIESDDMFQTESFIGGFDATERAFCFSYFDPSSREFWFQVTLAEVFGVLRGRILQVESQPASR